MTKSRADHVFGTAIRTSLYGPLTGRLNRVACQWLRYRRGAPKFLLRIIDYFSHRKECL